LVIVGPVANGCLRFFAAAIEARTVATYLRAVGVIFLAASAVLLLAMGGVTGCMLATGRKAWLALALSATALSWIGSGNSLLDGLQNAIRQRAIVAWHQALGQWLRLFGAVGLMLLFGARSSVAMWGYTLGAGAVLVSQIFFFRKKILVLRAPDLPQTPGAVAAAVRRIWAYGKSFALWGIFTWAHTSSDRWALTTFRNTRDVGLYQALYQVGYSPIYLLSTLLTQLLVPILFARAGDGLDHARLDKVRRLTNALVIPGVALTAVAVTASWLGRHTIFRLLTASSYHSVSGLLPWITLSAGLFSVGQIATLGPMSEVDTRALVAPKIVTALLGLSLNCLGAFYLGLHGVIFAGIAFALLYFVWISSISNRRRHVAK